MSLTGAEHKLYRKILMKIEPNKIKAGCSKSSLKAPIDHNCDIDQKEKRCQLFIGCFVLNSSNFCFFKYLNLRSNNLFIIFIFFNECLFIIAQKKRIF